MKNLLKYSVVVAVITYSILLVLQIWMELFESKIFIKITISFLIVFATIITVFATMIYNNEESDLKKNKYLN